MKNRLRFVFADGSWGRGPLLFVLVRAPQAEAQAHPANRLEFEVASIKPPIRPGTAAQT